jgi:cytoskeletal protein CcmA (bactofilin family)
MTAWRNQRAGAEPAPTPEPRAARGAFRQAAAQDPIRPAGVAHIGRITIQGELSGNEDLVLDGRVEGRVSLGDHHLTIGPNAEIRADITAREVTIHGHVLGNVTATGRVEIGGSGKLEGDLVAPRLVIHDGAWLSGQVRTNASPPRETKRAAGPESTGAAPA